MAVFQLARWRGPVPNRNAGAIARPLQGLVLHIQQGTEAGTEATFLSPTSQVSAHFGNPKSGSLDQWVDTNDVAWAQMAGNASWISVENEGNSGDVLTPTQLANAGALYAWLNIVEQVPLQLAESPTDQGLGYHGMGAAAWGNHPLCPGQPIVDQRATIVGIAQQLVVGPTISSVSPTSGTSGTTLTISGSGFTFATNVGFGDVSAAQISVDSDSQITVVAPNSSGTVDITVTTLVGTSATTAADQFTFAAAQPAPAVSGISPASGAAAGGDSVVVTGTGLAGATGVSFGQSAAAAFSVDSDTQLTATSPAGSGTVDVTVSAPAGASPATAADQFTYS